MTTQTTDTISQAFRQATEAFQTALETGARLQRETLRFWTQPIWGERPATDLREQGQKLAEASIQLVQKNVEESRRLLDSQCEQSLQLLRQAFDAAKTGDKTDLFETTRQMWRSSLDTLRHSVEELARANSQLVDNWTHFVHQSFDGHEKKAPAAK